jgi:hypothetical protein
MTACEWAIGAKAPIERTRLQHAGRLSSRSVAAAEVPGSSMTIAHRPKLLALQPTETR